MKVKKKKNFFLEIYSSFSYIYHYLFYFSGYNYCYSNRNQNYLFFEGVILIEPFERKNNNKIVIIKFSLYLSSLEQQLLKLASISHRTLCAFKSAHA